MEDDLMSQQRRPEQSSEEFWTITFCFIAIFALCLLMV